MIKATYVDHMGSDITVVNSARVSFGKRTEGLGYTGPADGIMTPILHDKDIKLIHYLAKHKHMSPFGHCFMSFHCKAPVFVARQLVKHKFLRWNEISRRYVDDGISFYYPDIWRSKATDKKQGSGPALVDQEIDLGTTYTVVAQLYNSLIQKGVCPEQARMVLPQSTMTEWYWSGSLDAFSDMCCLRLKGDTQEETQYIAKQVSDMMSATFPISWKALQGETNG